MSDSQTYRIGISLNEVNEVLGRNLSEQELIKAIESTGLIFKVVQPIEEIIKSAKQVLGKPFKRGASVLRDAPNAFDCSSFTSWCAVEAGMSIPRVSIDQFVFSKRLNKEDLNSGDLVFANTGEIIHTEGSYYSQVLGREVKEEAIRTETLEFMPGTKVPGGVDHVGIYIGNGNVAHASGQTNSVVEENLDKSKSFRNIVGYGRIINDVNKRFVVQIPGDRIDLRKVENLIKEFANFGL